MRFIDSYASIAIEIRKASIVANHPITFAEAFHFAKALKDSGWAMINKND